MGVVGSQCGCGWYSVWVWLVVSMGVVGIQCGCGCGMVVVKWGLRTRGT